MQTRLSCWQPEGPRKQPALLATRAGAGSPSRQGLTPTTLLRRTGKQRPDVAALPIEQSAAGCPPGSFHGFWPLGAQLPGTHPSAPGRPGPTLPGCGRARTAPGSAPWRHRPAGRGEQVTCPAREAGRRASILDWALTFDGSSF